MLPALVMLRGGPMALRRAFVVLGGFGVGFLRHRGFLLSRSTSIERSGRECGSGATARPKVRDESLFEQLTMVGVSSLRSRRRRPVPVAQTAARLLPPRRRRLLSTRARFEERKAHASRRLSGRWPRH